MIVTLNFPPTMSSWTDPTSVSARGLAPVVANANNQANFDLTIYSLEHLLSAGFTLAPTVCTTVNRPTAYLYPGQQIFDSTLGKPVWRNSANSGWVDATGASV